MPPIARPHVAAKHLASAHRRRIRRALHLAVIALSAISLLTVASCTDATILTQETVQTNPAHATDLPQSGTELWESSCADTVRIGIEDHFGVQGAQETQYLDCVTGESTWTIDYEIPPPASRRIATEARRTESTIFVKLGDEWHAVSPLPTDPYGSPADYINHVLGIVPRLLDSVPEIPAPESADSTTGSIATHEIDIELPAFTVQPGRAAQGKLTVRIANGTQLVSLRFEDSATDRWWSAEFSEYGEPLTIEPPPDAIFHEPESDANAAGG